MTCKALTQIVNSDRIGDIAQAEKTDEIRRSVLANAAGLNQTVHAELSKPYYKKMQRSVAEYIITARRNLLYYLR